MIKGMKEFFEQLKRLIGSARPEAPQEDDLSEDIAVYSIADGVFTDQFYSNLIRTINWTNSIMSQVEDPLSKPALIFRVTNPTYRDKPFYTYGKIGYPDVELEFDYKDIFRKAMDRRQNDVLTITDAHTSGAILEFIIDITTKDGGPCWASKGFVDGADIPPIDTWFYFTKTRLYCWIPAIFIPLMQDAIAVEILDSYQWIHDSNPALYLDVRKRLNLAYRTYISRSGNSPS